ncbi:hypothetical protein J2795_000438 [Chryseobacterium bernardetii]|jgi:hypothetical protein|uniref:Uncharacterized protein n=3 Tax=Chryseobacterium TaxID=59732 RepID=A0A543EMW1_9FLAO|nr:hypothetical protein [Chryseobacterium vietnamense]MDR6439753.1 hypothetical protein [Chryseobacterium bernardetii]MDR6459349.1 hypothetical protein [Chryseobacterium vietnamense]MDR6487630.1 hypothetical protein [Chryseobacterium vietnamense]TQM22925.1 hypothetical protein FB551_2649 [Chryseobacterium aquifrigidense]
MHSTINFFLHKTYLKTEDLPCTKGFLPTEYEDNEI